MKIASIGHSNRTLEELLGILRSAGVRQVADVRRYPESKRHPHFSKAQFSRSIEDAGLCYRHFADLGGMREPHANSKHRALRDAAFRGYADHMETDRFASAILELETWAAESMTAYLCAEAEPGSCHRRLLSDALQHRGHEVVHLLDTGRSLVHERSAEVRVGDGRLIYDAGLLELPF